jgi:hypothetical protein
MSSTPTDEEQAERFVGMLNTFDVAGVDGLIAPGFTFQIGPHVSDRADFLASLATGLGSDPYFRFEPQDYEETDAGVVTVVGRQVYRWRESDEVASSTGQALRLEFADAIVSRATVEPRT